MSLARSSRRVSASLTGVLVSCVFAASAHASLTVSLDAPGHDGGSLYYGQGAVATATVEYPEAPNHTLRYDIDGANPLGPPGSVTTDGAGHAQITWTGTNIGGDTVTVFDDANTNGIPDDAQQDAAFASFIDGRIIPAGGSAITAIAIGRSLWCQANYAGDDNGEFFSSFPGSCGTYARIGGTLVPFNGTSQSPVSGTGTSGDPYTVTTQGAIGSTGLDFTSVVTYVTGQDTYRDDVTLTDTTGTAQSLTLAQYADCYLGNNDAGYGYFDPSSGGTFCTKTPNNSPPDRLEGFVPLTAGYTRMEGHYSTVFSWMQSNDTFPDTCDCVLPSPDDNGMGLSWQLRVPANGSVTRSFLTAFSPVGTVPVTGGGSSTPPPVVSQEQPPEPVQTQAPSQSPPLAPDVPPPPPTTPLTGNATPISGTVLVRLPGSLEYVEINKVTSLPVGTVIDATRGVVDLTVLADTLGHVQTGEFSLGKFRFESHLANGSATKLITNLKMAGGKWGVCAAPDDLRSAVSTRRWAEIARRRVVRYLMAKAHGSFRVVGRDATGIERGTEWETLDTCKSTEVRVIDGSVLVTDLVLNKKFVITGGHTYAAHDFGVSRHPGGRR